MTWGWLMRVRENQGAEQDVDLAGVFIAIGHTPNTGIFADQVDMEGGYIQNSGIAYATAISVPGVFAAGAWQITFTVRPLPAQALAVWPPWTPSVI